MFLRSTQKYNTVTTDQLLHAVAALQEDTAINVQQNRLYCSQSTKTIPACNIQRRRQSSKVDCRQKSFKGVGAFVEQPTFIQRWPRQKLEILLLTYLSNVCVVSMTLSCRRNRY